MAWQRQAAHGTCLSKQQYDGIVMADAVKITGAILVDAAVLEAGDPEAVLTAVEEFARWAVEDAMLATDEFPVAAIFIGNLIYYIGQVENGGHWQFAGNTNLQPVLLNRIVNALHLTGAHDYREIFSEFCEIMAADAELTAAALRGDYTRLPESIKSLDKRFYALGSDELMRKMESWVRSLPAFKPLPAAALAEAKAEVIARNKKFKTRTAAAKAAKRAAEDSDPKMIAARRLCKAAGLKFLWFNPGTYHDGRKTIKWGINTDKGVHYLIVGPEGAELLPLGAGTLRVIDRGRCLKSIMCLLLTMAGIIVMLYPSSPHGAIYGLAGTLFFAACSIFNIRRITVHRRSLKLDKTVINKAMLNARKRA